MKIILPVLTLMLALCAATAAHAQLPRIASVERAATLPDANAATPNAVSRGDQLIGQVAAQLEHRESLAARLRYHVSLDGRQLAGAGSYWQQGTGNTLRVRLELRIAGETNLLQVSNGRFLWNEISLPTGRHVSRLDLRQLRSDASLVESDFGDIGAGQVAWSPFRPELAPYSGGLPALVTSLEEHFTFSPPQAMRWTPSPPLSGVENGKPVFAVVGRWKRDQLAALLPRLAKETNEESGNPPSRVPQEVLLLIGQSDLFPCRIEYRRLNDPAVAAESLDGAQLQLSANPLVLVEYYDVAFDASVSPEQFDYSPGDTDWNDRTAEYLDKLRLRRQQQIAKRHGVDPR